MNYNDKLKEIRKLSMKKGNLSTKTLLKEISEFIDFPIALISESQMRDALEKNGRKVDYKKIPVSHYFIGYSEKRILICYNDLILKNERTQRYVVIHALIDILRRHFSEAKVDYGNFNKGILQTRTTVDFNPTSKIDKVTSDTLDMLLSKRIIKATMKEVGEDDCFGKVCQVAEVPASILIKFINKERITLEGLIYE